VSTKSDFQDKHVIVTGGANGIGLATSKAFAAAGASVWIVDLPNPELAAIAQSIGAHACEADVSSRSSLEETFARMPEPHAVVVNAGITSCQTLLETTPEAWDRTLAVNLNGAFHTIQIAAEKMRRGGGSIVLTASTNSYDGEPGLFAYNASKAALLGILHSAANELGPYGIRVNAVCPGLIRTRLNADSFANPQVLSEYFKHVPLGRGGEPEEVAQAILFLASSMASYITGAALLVDGGQLASKFGPWGKEGDRFDGQRWIRQNKDA
jgi:NAD(P)-dependent dehydrogenase (short-subunit alcohol dehydrogenase family)